MMRILIVHNVLWAHYKSKLFEELHQQSHQYNCEIEVAQIALSEHSRAAMGMADAFRYNYPYELLFDDTLENVSFWPKTKRLFQKIHQFKPAVLNITGYYDPAQLLLMLYAKICGIAVVISNESTSQDQSRHWLKEIFKKTIVKLADGFFCFGQSSANYLLQLGATPNKILTTHAAVIDDKKILENYHKAQPTRYQQQQSLNLRPHNFIFVGRLIPYKNLYQLIEAFGRIQNADWGLIILGEGEQKQELIDFCTKQKIAGVQFLAGVNWYDVPTYLALADVLVLPSSSEPWGLVVNEAMVCGLPVIVSDKCGCALDLVKNNENGFIFDPQNLTDLAEKMTFFVQNSSKISVMGKQSTQIIAAFSAKEAAQEMLLGYKSSLSS
jgi:glycosyltransferase involved in cell wall biosynthesis